MITSKIKVISTIEFPAFNPGKLYMIPFELSNPVDLPNQLKQFNSVITDMINNNPIKNGIAYLTIDCKSIKAGDSHRRGGPHVDGNYILRDKDDDKFIICAMNANVDYLISGDMDIRSVKSEFSFKILSPRQFLNTI